MKGYPAGYYQEFEVFALKTVIDFNNCVIESFKFLNFMKMEDKVTFDVTVNGGGKNSFPVAYFTIVRRNF